MNVLDLQIHNRHFVNYKHGEIWDYYGKNYIWLDENSTDDKIIIHARQNMEADGHFELTKQDDESYRVEEWGYTKAYGMYDHGVTHCSSVTLDQIDIAMQAEARRQTQKYEDSFHPWSDASFSMRVGKGNPIKEEVSS